MDQGRTQFDEGIDQPSRRNGSGALRSANERFRRKGADQPTYSPIARSLHWWTAGLVAVQIPVGLYMAYRGNTLNLWDATTNTLYSSHKLVGLIILALVLSRLAYRMVHGTPPDEPTIEPWQKIVSHINHWLLYALLVAVPIGGYVGISLYPALDIFSVGLPGLVAPDQQAAARVFYWHMVGAFGIVVLAGLHISAAVYHYYMRQDGVLRRMLVRAGYFSSK
jgi:cytochrome b561